jgi:dTDP-4-dehydrorhamnose reductase
VYRDGETINEGADVANLCSGGERLSGILVIGRGGQLALSLAERAPEKGIALRFVGRPEVDLADPDSLRRAVARYGPEVIVNAAAYTRVDDAEDHPDAARQLNAIGPAVLAEAATAAGARLVHVSTDYVFDGSGDRPWREDDPADPRTVYGRTKLEGEDAVRSLCPNHVIVRTAWVYSPFGANFVRTMLSLAQTRATLQVVGDQTGNPTSALDLADGLLAMIARWQREHEQGVGATYHFAGKGETDWASFARAIFAISKAEGGPTATVEAIDSAQWPARAPRPRNSRLDTTRFATVFDYRLASWTESLPPVVRRLLASR